MACVLLVDDEAGLLEALASYLRLGGIETVAADSLHSALEVLARRDVQAVITDEHLADGSGRVVIDRFLAAQPDGRALLCTANPNATLEQWIDSRPSVDLRKKPVRPAQLKEWLAESDAPSTPATLTVTTLQGEVCEQPVDVERSLLWE